MPRYPEIRVRLRTANAVVWIAEVRSALRRAGVETRVIEEFSAEAFRAEGSTEVRRICGLWVALRKKRR